MKSRVTSSIIIGLLSLALIIFNDSFPILLNITIAIISALCVHEILRASGLEKHVAFLVPSVTFALAYPFNQYFSYDISFLILSIYSFILFLLLIYYHHSITFKDVAIIYCTSVMIPSALSALLLIRELHEQHGLFFAILAVTAAWVPDMGAFFAGTFLGKRKLCPDISPKKTVEGFIGGIIVNIIFMIIAGLVFTQIYYQGTKEVNYLILVLIGFFGAIVSTVGDLSFSLIKRSCGIKDFGQMIPGHGGLLDRFDSVIFTLPCVYIILTYFQLVIS